MAEEPENHTIRLLQELRAEQREMRAELGEMRADLTQRIDGNAILINMVAGLLSNHEDRISILESRLPS